MFYIWLQACILGDMGVIGCTSKVIVPIKQLWLYTLMQSCDVFHTQHAIFFATIDTRAGTMGFGYHKVYMC